MNTQRMIVQSAGVSQGVIVPYVEGIYSIARDHDERWFVIHCAPRCETKVAQALVARRISNYLPRTRRWKRQSMRAKHQKEAKRQMTAPLLTGYVFATIPPDKDGRVPFGRVSDLDGVHRILSDSDGPLIVGRDLVEEIERRETAGEFDDTTQRLVLKGRALEMAAVPKWIEEGLAITVTSGPFSSFPAVIEGVLSDDRVRVGIMMFGQRAPVELTIDQIRPA